MFSVKGDQIKEAKMKEEIREERKEGRSKGTREMKERKNKDDVESDR